MSGALDDYGVGKPIAGVNIKTINEYLACAVIKAQAAFAGREDRQTLQEFQDCSLHYIFLVS